MKYETPKFKSGTGKTRLPVIRKEKVYECEVRRLFMVNGKKEWKWVRALASDVLSTEELRCHECKGRVRLHRQRKSDGPRDHVEHITREDSEACPLGFYFRRE